MNLILLHHLFFLLKMIEILLMRQTQRKTTEKTEYKKITKHPELHEGPAQAKHVVTDVKLHIEPKPMLPNL